MDAFVQENPRCGNSHMSMPLQVLTVRTSLFTCKYSQVYMFQITDTLVYKPIVCKLTYVCALASAHTSNLFVYMQISRNRYIYIYIYRHIKYFV